MHRTSAKPKTCSTWSCWDALRYRSQCASSKHRWDARSQFSTKHRMCCQQMIPKRRRAACDGELHTTSFAICNMPSVQQQRTLFTAAPTGAKWFETTETRPRRPARLCSTRTFAHSQSISHARAWRHTLSGSGRTHIRFPVTGSAFSDMLRRSLTMKARTRMPGTWRPPSCRW